MPIMSNDSDDMYSKNSAWGNKFTRMPICGCGVFYISQFLGVILDTHICSTMEEREIEDDERMNINLHLRSHPLMSVDLISGEFITNPKVCSQSSIVSSFTLTTIHSFIQKERAT